MSTSFRSFLRHQQISMAITNVVCNGAFAWLLTEGVYLSLWQGKGAIGPDLLATSLILAYLVALGGAFGLRKKRDSGKTPALTAPPHPWIARLPSSTGRLALVIAVLGTVIGLLTVGALSLLGLDPFPRDSYIVLKSIYAGLLAMGCNYLVIFTVLGETATAAVSAPAQ